MKTFFAILFWVAVALFVTADLHHYAIPYWDSPHAAVSFGDTEVPWTTFFTVFGMMYAIMSGFLLLKVLDRFTSLSKAVDSEVNSLQDARDLLVYFEPNQTGAKKHMIMQLMEYLNSVGQVEWKLMSRRKGDSMSSDTTQELRDIMTSVKQLEVTNYTDQVALNAMIEKLSSVTSSRTDRITLAYERLPAQLKLLLTFLSVILIGGFVLMPVGNAIVHLSMVGTVAAAVYLLAAAIFDLDHPFTGAWNISKKPLLDAEKRFKEELESIEKEEQQARHQIDHAAETLPRSEWNPVACRLVAS